MKKRFEESDEAVPGHEPEDKPRNIVKKVHKTHPRPTEPSISVYSNVTVPSSAGRDAGAEVRAAASIGRWHRTLRRRVSGGRSQAGDGRGEFVYGAPPRAILSRVAGLEPGDSV